MGSGSSVLPRHGRLATFCDGALEGEVAAAELLPVYRYQDISGLDHGLETPTKISSRSSRRKL